MSKDRNYDIPNHGNLIDDGALESYADGSLRHEQSVAEKDLGGKCDE